MNLEDRIEDYKSYVLKHFELELSCENPQILTQMHLAKEKIFNWIGFNGLDCCCPCTLDSDEFIWNCIFLLTYYYTTAGYEEELAQLEMAVYLRLKNQGYISF